MTRPVTKLRSEEIRERIKATQILERVQCYILNEPGPQGEVVKFDKQQMAGAIALLKKVIPDLQNIEAHHTGELGVTVTVSSTDAQL